VRKQPDANTVEVAEGLGRRLAQLDGSRFIPDDVHYEVVGDQAFFIRSAVGGVLSAALVGAALAMLVVLLFLGSLRKTFIIGLSIPLAVLATFMMMGMGRLSLNIMSLGGLALGIGLLIDNSIVMLELGLGSGGGRLLLASLFLTSAGPQLRQSARGQGGCAGDEALARRRRRRVPARRHSLSGRARRHQQ
jgi:hypothetical protein